MNEYDLAEAFRRIENELMASMIRNMDRHRAEETEEGYNWSMWQAEQLKALERYKRNNRKKYQKQFRSINAQIEELIRMAREKGNMHQEMVILKNIRRGYRFPGVSEKVYDLLDDMDGRSFKEKAALLLDFIKGKKTSQLSGEFFKLNDRKLEALIKATMEDMEKAETAVLRKANDDYRKAIYNAQVYANIGAGTYEQAVDMATKDMLSRGLNCVIYANGARHALSDYADMAIRTASKRAYLQGEGEKRQEWGVTTVIMAKRGNPCPKCLPFVGKVLIDDVWSGGRSDGVDPETGKRYPLMSYAISKGLYHPRCKDSHTTYFPGISTADDTWTQEELKKVGLQAKQEVRQQYAQRQKEKYDRLARYSLDLENAAAYGRKATEWKDIAMQTGSDIIDSSVTKEDTSLHIVGKIDRNIYRCITEDITTDEVIITDERIQHIKDRHPNDYEKYYEYLKCIVEAPDYIVETNKPDTALILKEIVMSDEKQFKTVLRLKTSKDKPEFKNSIITFMKINEKEWSRLLRNKQILYKKE